MKKYITLIAMLLLFSCDDDVSSSCNSSQLSGTWDIYLDEIYPLGCSGECISNCGSVIDNSSSHSDSENDMKIENDCRASQYRDYGEGGYNPKWDDLFPFNLTEIDVDSYKICPPSFNDDGSCFIIHKISEDTLIFMSDNGQYLYPDENYYCKVQTFYLR